MVDTTDSASPRSVLDLAGCEYVLLTTYTRDGTAKPTPVWAAADADALVVVTGVDAWKVRRVSHEPRVTLTACDARGNPRGAPVDGVAVVVNGVLVQRVRTALSRKYGWKLAGIDLLSRFRSGGERVGLVIRDTASS